MKNTPVIPSRADQIRAEAKRSRGTSSSSDEISLLRASRSGRDDGVRRRALLKAAALLPLLLPFGARVVDITVSDAEDDGSLGFTPKPTL